jgi:hypothetical protein
LVSDVVVWCNTNPVSELAHEYHHSTSYFDPSDPLSVITPCVIQSPSLAHVGSWVVAIVGPVAMVGEPSHGANGLQVSVIGMAPMDHHAVAA